MGRKITAAINATAPPLAVGIATWPIDDDLIESPDVTMAQKTNVRLVA